MGGEPRVLTMTEVGKRVEALDALYMNADRRYREMQVIDKADAVAWLEAYNRWLAARREYERVRDTPYRIEGEGGETHA